MIVVCRHVIVVVYLPPNDAFESFEVFDEL